MANDAVVVKDRLGREIVTVGIKESNVDIFTNIGKAPRVKEGVDKDGPE